MPIYPLMPARSMTERWVTRLLVWLMCVAMYGCQRNEPGEAGRAPVRVITETVQAQTVDVVRELAGRTLAYERAEVRPQIAGIVKRRAFKEGSEVLAGQVLYEVDPQPYQAAYKRANGELASATSELATLAPKMRRYRELAQLNAVSTQELDDVEGAVRSARAKVDTAQAAMQRARIDLQRTRIRAPISGSIGTSSVTIGALLTAEQTDALAVIERLDPIHVDMVQPSASWLALRKQIDAGQLHTRQAEIPLRLSLEDGSDYPHLGRVKVVDARVDPTTATVLLRAEVPNPDKILLPGMYVKSRLVMGAQTEAILVPQRAVERDGKGRTWVWLVDGADKAERRAVELGEAFGTRWLVSSGLEPGERVITDGRASVRHGQLVAVDPAEPPTLVKQ